MLLAIDLHEDFIDKEGVTVASMLALQSPSVNGPELYAPESDGFIGNGDATLSKKVFNISMAQVESVIQPNCIADDIGREPVTFVGTHHRIIDYGQLSCQYPE
jgi:hypothetical protein